MKLLGIILLALVLSGCGYTLAEFSMEVCEEKYADYACKISETGTTTCTGIGTSTLCIVK